jgi:hypothetical protein
MLGFLPSTDNDLVTASAAGSGNGRAIAPPRLHAFEMRLFSEPQHGEYILHRLRRLAVLGVSTWKGLDLAWLSVDRCIDHRDFCCGRTKAARFLKDLNSGIARRAYADAFTIFFGHYKTLRAQGGFLLGGILDL